MYDTWPSPGEGGVYVFVLALCLALASPMFAQSSGAVGVDARVNMRGMPMAGITYSMTDRLDVRLMAGYFQRDSWDRPACPPRFICWPAPVDYTVHEYGAALAGLYDLVHWKMITLQGGAEVGYVLAHAPNRPSNVVVRLDGASPYDKINSRLSFSVITGISARLFPWLVLFLEGGLGYDRGMPRSDDGLPRFRRRENGWSLTHFSPGLRVSL